MGRVGSQTAGGSCGALNVGYSGRIAIPEGKTKAHQWLPITRTTTALATGSFFSAFPCIVAKANGHPGKYRNFGRIRLARAVFFGVGDAEIEAN